MNERVNTEGMFFNAGNENMNMRQKFDAPVEKHEEACRTSDQRHPFEKREKTFGTNEAESSPKTITILYQQNKIRLDTGTFKEHNI